MKKLNDMKINRNKRSTNDLPAKNDKSEKNMLRIIFINFNTFETLKKLSLRWESDKNVVLFMKMKY